MQNRIMALVLGAAVLAAPTRAQTAKLPAPSPVEKALAARASSVDEVTLDKNMLAFAAKFRNQRVVPAGARSGPQDRRVH